MADLGQMALQITADPTSFEAGLKSAAEKAAAFKDKIAGMTASIQASFAAVAANPVGAAFMAITVAAGAAAAAMQHAMSTARTAADEQGRLQRTLGLSAIEAGGLARQIALTGGNIDEAAEAGRHFSIRLIQAARDGGPMAEGLQRLGLNASELVNLPLPEQLARIGDATRGAGNAGQQLATINELVGRRGAALVPIIRQGAQSMTEAQRAAAGYALQLAQLNEIQRENQRIQRAVAEGTRETEVRTGGGIAGVVDSVKTRLTASFQVLANSFIEMAQQGGGPVAFVESFTRQRNEIRSAMASVGQRMEAEEAAARTGRANAIIRQANTAQNAEEDPLFQRLREEQARSNTPPEEARRQMAQLEQAIRDNAAAVRANTQRDNAVAIQQQLDVAEHMNWVQEMHHVNGAQQLAVIRANAEDRINAQQATELAARARRLDEAERDRSDLRRLRNVNERGESLTQDAQFLRDIARLRQLNLGADGAALAEIGRRGLGLAGADNVSLASSGLTSGSASTVSLLNQSQIQTDTGPDRIIAALERMQEQQRRDAEIGRELIARLGEGGGFMPAALP